MYFETYLKTTKYYFPCIDVLDTFVPPDVSKYPRYVFLQPQTVQGTVVLMASYPDREKVLQKCADGSVRKAQKKDPNGQCYRRLCCFAYCDRLSIKNEIVQRVLDHPFYRNIKVEFHPFEVLSEGTPYAVNSFVYVLHLALLMLEGKFEISQARAHLSMTRYSIMSKTLLGRLIALSEKEWVGSRRAKK